MDTKELIQALADKLMWVAPVGNYVGDGYDPKTKKRIQLKIRGFMVCRRMINNVDAPGNTRVDYLMTDGGWKKPFAEDRNMFPTLTTALRAAAKAANL